MSSQEQWAQVKDLFEAARALPAAERRIYIEANSTGELRRELLSLLETYEALEADPETGEFLERPVAASAAEILSEGWAGKRFGAYEARRLLGEGGMGSVYEGVRADGALEEHPRELQRVAIKIMKPELVSAHLLERFRQERQILASLDHPHIARLLDGGEQPAGVHAASPWPAPYMVMEFIDGIPITQYALSRQLTGRQSAALVADICDAVGYAHGRQVVHRDIKPGNILVDSAGRSKLLDFGISKITSPDGDVARTATVLRMATPDYASPEQLRGAAAGPQSDIFSLGAVLYEMISGKRMPRDAWMPLAESALDRIARKACSDRAEDRYATAGEMGDDLRRFIAGERVLAPRPPNPWILPVAGVVVLLLIGLAIWRQVNFAGNGKPTVAVLQLRNLSGKQNTAWVSTAATEVLASELGAGGVVRVIPEEQTVSAVRELGLEPADSYTADTLRRLSAYLNADRIVTGSYLSMSDQPSEPLRFQFRMQNTHSGAIESPVTETASIAELPAMATRASSRFRQALGVATPAGQGLPESKPEALRYFADGLTYQRDFEIPKARVAFEQAIALDPSFSMAHFRLSQVFRALGSIPQADAEIRLAQQTSGGLRPEERLLIEGSAILRGPVKQRPDSVAVFRRLAQLESFSVDSELLLLNAQMLVNDSKGFEETLRDLRSRQREGDAPRIDLVESEYWTRHGNMLKAWRAGTHGAEAARKIGSRLLMAECLLKTGIADERSGNTARALAELREAEDLFSASGNHKGVADVRNARAGVFLHLAETQEAIEEFKAVASIAKEMGNRNLEAVGLSNLGIAYNSLDMGEEAVAAHLRAIEALKEVHDLPNLSHVYVNLATAYMITGDLRAAADAAHQGLAVAQELGGGLADNASLTVAGVLEWQGRIAEAQKLCEEANAGFLKTGQKRFSGYARSMLGEMAFDSGEDEAAGAHYAAALAIARETEEQDLIPLIYSDQARMALAHGDYAETSRLARLSLGSAVAGKSDNKDLLWHGYVALALAAQGNAAQAAEEEKKAAPREGVKPRPDLRIQLLTVLGWLRIKERRFTEAATLLEQARDLASQMPEMRGEAELALAEIHFATGDRAAAMAELRNVAAKSKGLRAERLAKERLAHPEVSWKAMP
jgi:serine/threonine protein kinase